MQQQQVELLKNVALVAAPLNLFSPERDTGERKTEDLVTDKRTIQFVDVKLLAGFRRKRTELRRMLLAYGTRVPLFGAYAIPVSSVDGVTRALESFTEEWNQLRNEFAQDYPAALEELKQKHPARAAEIARFAPTLRTLLKKMEFRFTVYEVNAGSIHAESGLANELLSLPERVMDDISKELNERAGQGQMFRQSIRDVLGRVRTKAEGFGFLHPVIAAIPEAIDKALANLPADGMIQGSDGILLGGLIGALQNRRILEVGIVTVSNIGIQTEAEQSVAAEVVSANDQDCTISAEPVKMNGTWDF